MLCLEIDLNGERYCRAGLGDEGAISAFVSWVKFGPPDPTVANPPGSVLLNVSGFTAEHTAVHWGDQSRHLATGDSVTIRIVDSDLPDVATITPILPALPGAGEPGED